MPKVARLSVKRGNPSSTAAEASSGGLAIGEELQYRGAEYVIAVAGHHMSRSADIDIGRRRREIDEFSGMGFVDEFRLHAAHEKHREMQVRQIRHHLFHQFAPFSA